MHAMQVLDVLLRRAPRDVRDCHRLCASGPVLRKVRRQLHGPRQQVPG